jgi:hypothetical protein
VIPHRTAARAVSGEALPGVDERKFSPAIYGSILATSLVAALDVTEATAQEMTLTLLSTTIVFAVAHAWSEAVSERIALGHGFLLARLIELTLREWPLVEAGFVPGAALALAWAGVWSAGVGAGIALTLAVLQLFGWGIVVGRRSYERWSAALAVGAVNGCFGLILVALKVAVH